MIAPLKGTVFVPATIGNVGPGFDSFGLCIDSLGDFITVELTEGPSEIVRVEGVDANAVPRDVTKNCTAIAAISMLRRLGLTQNVKISCKKSIPVSGGLGSSAAASVGGALGALYATGKTAPMNVIASAALDGEAFVAGRHLDNIAPCLVGGLTVVRDSDTVDFTRLGQVPDWWVTIVTPKNRLDTKTARSVLPSTVNRDLLVTQMAHACSLIVAFANRDPQLARRSLVDFYAEPPRAKLLPGFLEAKAAAFRAGALGASISGAGPSIFAISETCDGAEHVRAAISQSYGNTSLEHIGQISAVGAHQIKSFEAGK